MEPSKGRVPRLGIGARVTRENFGRIVSKRGHRVIQLAARFEF
jgi:hypothetical protein